MNFHSEYIRDKRSRFYIPVKRILRSNLVENPQTVVGNKEYQTVIHYLPEMLILHPGGSLLLDFGTALHGGVRINNYASIGTVQLKFGESVSEAINDSNQDSSRKTANLELPHYGMLEYGNTVFRFVQITNTGDTSMQILNIMAVALELDLEVTGSFESSDEQLNKIWKTAIRTVHLCMQDYLYDGAKRDRIIWMGDMHPEMKGVLCAFSDTGIIRDSFEFLIRQTPANQPMNGDYYSYNCWFIISLWEYYFATGDRDFLHKHAGYIRIMLELFSSFVGPNGQEQLPPERFLDWPNQNDAVAKHAGLQALLFWMLDCGAKILNELQIDNSKISSIMQLMQKYQTPDTMRKAPAALLTLTGLKDCSNVLAHNPLYDISTFYGYYVLQASHTLAALEVIRRYWGGMLELGATSFWEDFDILWLKNAGRIDELPTDNKVDVHKSYGNFCYKGLRHSLSHGWSCGPAPFLSERILGIKFLVPGGRQFTVSPDLGDLEYVKGSLPTPYGVITVEADRSGKIKVEHPGEISLIK